MNYDQVNRVYAHLRDDLLPHLSHNQTVSGFEDYIKRFSYLPSGKWIRDLEWVKFVQLSFVVDSKKFAEKYRDKCVVHNSPIQPNEGLQHAIYQFSPKVHASAGFWAWIEHDNLFYYTSLFFCIGDKKEFDDLVAELWEIHQEGNTEEKSPAVGFSGLMGQQGLNSLFKKSA